MIEFKDWVEEKYGIRMVDSQVAVAQRIINNEYDKESSLARMAREYAVEMASESSANDSLARQIRTMSVRSSLYKTLKTELTARGWWKNRPRGKPGSF